MEIPGGETGDIDVLGEPDRIGRTGHDALPAQGAHGEIQLEGFRILRGLRLDALFHIFGCWRGCLFLGHSDAARRAGLGAGPAGDAARQHGIGVIGDQFDMTPEGRQIVHFLARIMDGHVGLEEIFPGDIQPHDERPHALGRAFDFFKLIHATPPTV